MRKTSSDQKKIFSVLHQFGQYVHIFVAVRHYALCIYKDEKYKDTHTYKIVEQQIKKLIVN